MRNLIRAVLAPMLLLQLATAWAETVPDLYHASVPVEEQSAAELKRAAAAGLAEVLVRVSGRSDVASDPAVADALGNAESYLDQYRYEHTDGTPPWQARLRFAPDPVDRLLRGAGLPVWGANRPGVLVWLAVDDGSSRSLVNDENHPDVVAALRAEAARRGLLLHFPVLDLDDMQALSVNDVWNLDEAKVKAAALRYHPDALLIGRLSQAGGSWQGAWLLSSAGQDSNTANSADNLQAYLAPGIDRVADALAAQYAVASTSAVPEGLLLRLTGIANFDDYARALAYLHQLGAVKAAQPVQVEGDQVLLRLQIEGSLDQLTRQLALDNRLSPENTAPAAAPGQPVGELDYHWSGARG